MIPFIGPLLAIGGELVKNWTDAQENKRQIRKAADEFRAEQARSDSAYKREWELKALEGSDQGARRLILALFLWPLVWGYFDPEGVTLYFETVAGWPDWYKGAVVMMLSVIFGVQKMQELRAGK